MINTNEIEDYAEQNLKENTTYFKLPSISAQNKSIKETVAYLTDRFSKLGAREVKVYDQYQNPAILATFKGKNDQTLLFYNHYDVQPPEPLDEWLSDPFEPTFRDGKLFGRGVCDDKGELASRLGVVEYFQTHGGLPCNLKFFVEGEEEIGSPDIDAYVKDAGHDLDCDAIIWEGGGKNEADQFGLLAGAKGIASFDANVVTAEKDTHSSLAAYMDNAAWRLVQGLSSIYGPDRKINVEHFYDDVEPLSDYAAEQIETGEQYFDAEKVVKTFGIKNGQLPVDNPFYASMNEPTITINGLSSGYEGPGAKTIIPRSAHAKLDCRLVPNQDPATIVRLLQDQLDRNGFPDVKLTYNLGDDAFRTDLQDPFVQRAVTTAKELFGDQSVALIPNQPGGGPLKPFADQTHAPILGFGVHYSGSTPHAPNENIRLADYRQGSAFLATLLDSMNRN